MVTEEAVMSALGQCFDPEIRNVSIVDLGLIYDVSIDNDKVNVKMTLTTPGCGMSKYISEDAKQKIEQLDGVNEVNVEIVWDPPWNPNMMNEETKKQLGFG